MDDKVFSEKAAIVLVSLALIGGMVVGNLIGYDCGFEDGYTKGIDKPNDIPIIYIPYIEPPQPTGYFFITSITPCSEPYYINATPSDFKVGDWVKSNSNYVFFMKNSFNGQVIEISDNVVTVCINNDTYTHVNKYWLMHWDCVLVMYNPDIGYFCSTELMNVDYNEDTIYITKIYAD
jgi:hypothetical protein